MERADLVCFSHLRWHFVTQRPQHLLVRAAIDRRVFYWEEPVWDVAAGADLSAKDRREAWLEILQEGASLWVVRPHLAPGADPIAAQKDLLHELQQRFQIKPCIRWYYTPMALAFSDDLPAVATVYDCMDELKNFLGAPPELVQREQQLFEAADVVFTGGLSLYEAKRQQHRNVHAFPSSIDVEHFSSAKSGAVAEPADQSSIAAPRAGFYGVVDERFDIDLLGRVAQLRPEVHFVILGPVVKIDPATLPQGANIHYLGSKSYDQLPAYLAGWDVALLPFALNEATRFISPTKTPEYLAAGKPVVSTPIRDVVRDYGEAGLVAIAAGAAAFAAALDRALQPQTNALQTDGWRNAVAQKLVTMSWDRTWAAMQEELDCLGTSGDASQSQLESGGVAGLVAVSASLQATASVAPLWIDRMLGSPARNRQRRTDGFDTLIVGAGFAGCVLAERLASQMHRRVLLIDRRDHIGGNAYDFHNEHGILVHQYGPHIFHTNSDEVVKYLSRFTTWRPYEHRVLASVQGKLLPVPINLDTVNGLYGLQLDSDGLREFLAQRTITPAQIRTSEDIVVSRVGRELYETFFRNYTRKQWGLDPSELDASVAGRIPVRFDRDDRYFTDSFQAMPQDGYTRMFERMLDQPGITVRTGVEYADVARTYPNARVVFTGPIDEYYGFRFGALPYRSLHFRHETHHREVYQRAPVVNYPNDHDYTRVTEFKYLTGQRHAMTSIVYEYPRAEGDPYYPIPRPENAAIYAKYRELAERDTNVDFCGRLANYKYFNMDQVVAQALHTFRGMAEQGSLQTTPEPVSATSLRRPPVSATELDVPKWADVRARVLDAGA